MTGADFFVNNEKIIKEPRKNPEIPIDLYLRLHFF